MNQKKKPFFDVNNLAVPEIHLTPRQKGTQEEKTSDKKNGKHHLHSKTDAVAVPEVELEDD